MNRITESAEFATLSEKAKKIVIEVIKWGKIEVLNDWSEYQYYAHFFPNASIDEAKEFLNRFN